MTPMTVLVEPYRPASPPPSETSPAGTCRESAPCTRVRADLRGVYAFADIVEESVRWSA